jgi:L-asparaginase
MPVIVVTTGGTIASRADPATGRVVPVASADELVSMISRPIASDLELDDFLRIPSWELHGDVALTLAKRVSEHLARPDVPGVVVTQGTDTMEETVYLVDRLLVGEKPVVLTGAQRAADEQDADGPRNIGDAINIACAPRAAGRGAMIAFAGEIHAAREVRKVHTSALSAFASPGYGPIGHVDGPAVTFQRRPERNEPLADSLTALETRVDLIKLYAGSDARFIHTSIADGARAIVLEATGRGNANEAVLAGVRDAVAAGISVVVCSRCTEGRVEPIYGRGGGRDLADAGALFAGDLAGSKTRIFLQVALAAGVDVAGKLERERGGL